MQVITIICETMRLVGRTSEAECVERDDFTEEAARLLRVMNTYFKAVIDELARGYFPVETVEEMSSASGIYRFYQFKFSPAKIKRVTDGKNDVEWSLSLGYLKTDCKKITVYYEYLPEELEEDDEFCYPDLAVNPRLVEYGMAAEYYLVAGDGDAYNAWESRYRAEIEMLLSRSNVKDRIPPRRWI